MTVQSARINKLIIGDDAVLTHQIMGDVAFSAEESRVPVLVSSGDLVDFFYPQLDPTVSDLQGYRGVPVGSYPTSQFTVPIASSLPAVGGQAAQGSSKLLPGLGQTVRAEILRLKANPTGDLTAASNVVSNVSSFTGVALGMTVLDPNLPGGTIVVTMDTIAGTLTLSNSALSTAPTEALSIGAKQSYYLYDEVDILARNFPEQPGGSNPNLT